MDVSWSYSSWYAAYGVYPVQHLVKLPSTSVKVEKWPAEQMRPYLVLLCTEHRYSVLTSECWCIVPLL